MADNKPVPGEGNVEITLAGEKKVLTPTLRAMRQISRGTDGLAGAVSKVQKQDFDAICVVIAMGLDLTEKGMEGLEEKVFQTGTLSLAAPCVRYLTILANGGKPIKEDGEAEENPPVSA